MSVSWEPFLLFDIANLTFNIGYFSMWLALIDSLNTEGCLVPLLDRVILFCQWNSILVPWMWQVSLVSVLSVYLAERQLNFYRGFVAYLKGAPHYNFNMYKALVNEITNTFNNISHEIIRIAKSLHASQRTDLSTIIQTLQDLEQLKLATVSKTKTIEGLSRLWVYYRAG